MWPNWSHIPLRPCKLSNSICRKCVPMSQITKQLRLARSSILDPRQTLSTFQSKNISEHGSMSTTIERGWLNFSLKKTCYICLSRWNAKHSPFKIFSRRSALRIMRLSVKNDECVVYNLCVMHRNANRLGANYRWKYSDQCSSITQAIAHTSVLRSRGGSQESGQTL